MGENGGVRKFTITSTPPNYKAGEDKWDVHLVYNVNGRTGSMTEFAKTEKKAISALVNRMVGAGLVEK